MDFVSLGQIRTHFDLSSENPDEIKKELRIIIKTIHPDKNGGVFRTKADEKYFFEIQNALDYLENINTALVTRQELRALTQVLKDFIPASQSKVNEKALILETRIDSSIKYFKNNHILPKISTTVISTILTALWLFPKSISEHPVLKNYLSTNNPLFNILWLFAIVACGCTWVILKTFESKDEKIKKGLRLETNINKMFTSFIREYPLRDDKNGFIYFDEDALITFIMDYNFYRYYSSRYSLTRLKKFLFGGIDIDLAQSLCDVIIEKGISRNAIEKVENQSIKVTYRTKRSTRNEY
jgi:hypothetical protein